MNTNGNKMTNIIASVVLLLLVLLIEGAFVLIANNLHG